MQFTGQVSRFLGPYFAFPDNGTVYLHTSHLRQVAFGFLDGSSFDMHSVDLAEFGLIDTNTVVPFYGYRADGSVVFTSFTTDGITDGYGPLVDFQTFYFGPEFKGLTRVEIPGVDSGYSLDNLVIIVPEPSTGALLLLGAALVNQRFLFRRRQ